MENEGDWSRFILFLFFEERVTHFCKNSLVRRFLLLTSHSKKNNRKNHNLKAFNCNIRILIFRNCILVFVI